MAYFIVLNNPEGYHQCIVLSLLLLLFFRASKNCKVPNRHILPWVNFLVLSPSLRRPKAPSI